MRFRAFIAILLLAAACTKEKPVPPDAELKAALAQIRNAIRTFQSENGRYPHTLQELVPKHLPRIPSDPATGSASSWRLVTEERVAPSSDFTTDATSAAETFVIDVQSGAGPPYSSY